MLYNKLNQSGKRIITTCNYNQHINSRHPDRILQEHDMIYIHEGSWNVVQDDIEYTLNPGDVILLQGGHHHFGSRPCTSVVKTKFIHFSFHPDDSIEKCKDGQDFYYFPVVVHCGEDPSIEKHFNRIISYFWSDHPYSSAKASAYLDLLLCELSCIGTSKYSFADDIKKLINKTPHRFISNEEFAEKLGCSVRTVTSKFKKSKMERMSYINFIFGAPYF